jgi:cardiolipin synthase A/B
MKSFSILLFGLSLTWTLQSTAGKNADFLNRLEPLRNAKFVSTPETDHQSLINAFKGAKKTIYVGIFGISSKVIADALSTAAKRGVAVTVLCDKYCSSNPKRLAIFEQLKADGVAIYTTSIGFTISHWKMFVVDEKLAFISTMNFITSTDQMRDMGVFLTNPSIVKEIIQVFKGDILNAKNITAQTPPLTQPNLVWSPVNSEEKLNALIASADQSIDIWIENMGAKTIHQSLKDAVRRGVKVRVITSMCGMGMPGPAAFENLFDLVSGGILVKVMPFPATEKIPYTHAKTITADRKTIFLGSENFSANSILKARELGIIFKNSGIEKQMHDLYEGDWSVAVDLPTEAPASCSPLFGIAI